MKILYFAPIILSIFFLLPASVYSDSFTDSPVKIYVSGGMGPVNGDIMENEKNNYTLEIIYDDGMAEIGMPKFSSIHFGLSTEINILKLKRYSSLLGIELMYSYNRIKQEINTGGSIYKKKEREELFMQYHSLTVGPVYSLLPGLLFSEEQDSEWYSSTFINLFILAGPILMGDIYPAPIVRDSGPDYTHVPESSSFSGIQINAGTGLGFYFDVINIGARIYYSWNSVETEKRLYPEIEKKTVFSETRFDASIGYNI